MSNSRDQDGVGARPAVPSLPLDVDDRRTDTAAGRPSDEVAELLRTLEQENVRRLSVTLLIDLLALETDRSRAAELVCDATVLGEDLLLAGDYEDARVVIRALARHAADSRSAASQAARVALEGLVTTVAFREAADCAGEMDRRTADVFAELCRSIRAPYVAALLRARIPSTGRARRAS